MDGTYNEHEQVAVGGRRSTRTRTRGTVFDGVWRRGEEVQQRRISIYTRRQGEFGRRSWLRAWGPLIVDSWSPLWNMLHFLSGAMEFSRLVNPRNTQGLGYCFPEDHSMHRLYLFLDIYIPHVAPDTQELLLQTLQTGQPIYRQFYKYPALENGPKHAHQRRAPESDPCSHSYVETQRY